MRRVAASRVFLNEKEFHNNHVVELFEHLVVNHYPLEGELPMTEWLGGTIIIRGREAYYTHAILSPSDVQDWTPPTPHIQRLFSTEKTVQ